MALNCRNCFSFCFSIGVVEYFFFRVEIDEGHVTSTAHTDVVFSHESYPFEFSKFYPSEKEGSCRRVLLNCELTLFWCRRSPIHSFLCQINVNGVDVNIKFVA